MNTRIAYTNLRGESIELGCGGALHYLEHELRDWRWHYSTGAASGKVASFSRGAPKELTFPVGIAAATAEEGIALRNRLLAIGEPDVAASEPGRLEVGSQGWHLRCWIIGGEPTSYWMDDRYAEFELTLLVESPVWTRETEIRFKPAVEESGGVDFEFDFEFDFMAESGARSVSNDGMSSCDWLWRVYGPASSPQVRIGGNMHRVNVGVPDGARLEVDSARRSVRVVHDDGRVEDAYSKRERGGKGSGSYLFEKVPEGDSMVAWNGSYSFDVVLREERAAAPYEIG